MQYSSDELKEIIEEHAKWLRGNGGKRADFRGADLRHANLQGADLIGANLIGANLGGTNFRYADFGGADSRQNWISVKEHIDKRIEYCDQSIKQIMDQNEFPLKLTLANIRGAKDALLEIKQRFMSQPPEEFASANSDTKNEI